MAIMKKVSLHKCGAVAILLLGAVAWAQSDECYVTKRRPKVPKVAVDFCRSSFPEKACCVAGFDTVIGRVYDSLLGDLPDCATVGQDAKDALQRLFCMGCDPDQPKYTFYNTTGEVRVRVCSEFANKLDLKQFDSCGLTLAYTRGNECSDDDIVTASEYWGTGLSGITAFINDDAGGKPPLFENKDIDVVLEVVDHQPCYSDNSASAMHRMGGSFVLAVFTIWLGWLVARPSLA